MGEKKTGLTPKLPSDDFSSDLIDNLLDGVELPPDPDLFKLDERTIPLAQPIEEKKVIPVARDLYSETPIPERIAVSKKGFSSSSQFEAGFAQTESLAIAQEKILQLEKDNDRLREDSEKISAAAVTVKNKVAELSIAVARLETEKSDMLESAKAEAAILKGQGQFKDKEIYQLRSQLEELETRLQTDFKKIRIRERELENRLEISRAEKTALLRTKDDSILELKRKVDQQHSELENYRSKVIELNKFVELQNDQARRSVRALRLAMTHLDARPDAKEDVAAALKADVPIKKAE